MLSIILPHQGTNATRKAFKQISKLEFEYLTRLIHKLVVVELSLSSVVVFHLCDRAFSTIGNIRELVFYNSPVVFILPHKHSILNLEPIRDDGHGYQEDNEEEKHVGTLTEVILEELAQKNSDDRSNNYEHFVSQHSIERLVAVPAEVSISQFSES